MIEFHEIDENGRITPGGRLTKEQIRRCPFALMLPQHYRADGTCKCNCARERQRMIEEWDYTLADFRRVGLVL
jgi:hypothetical protein